jgi:acetyl-CoA carboxylase biotin carboxyl carrier protein
MSDREKSESPDAKLIESVWAEARDLIKRLEGSSVHRFAVQAGEYKIEIERGAPAPQAPPDAADAGVLATGSAIPSGPGPGPGVDPGARGASGVHMALDGPPADNRVAVLAPLVGTFYTASQPGAKPFVEEGDVVDPGQTVCIVEAMKLMNEVSANEGGRVAEIVVENGERVEFEQVLMYLEPTGE